MEWLFLNDLSEEVSWVDELKRKKMRPEVSGYQLYFFLYLVILSDEEKVKFLKKFFVWRSLKYLIILVILFERMKSWEKKSRDWKFDTKMIMMNSDKLPFAWIFFKAKLFKLMSTWISPKLISGDLRSTIHLTSWIWSFIGIFRDGKMRF